MIGLHFYHRHLIKHASEILLCLMNNTKMTTISVEIGVGTILASLNPSGKVICMHAYVKVCKCACISIMHSCAYQFGGSPL